MSVQQIVNYPFFYINDVLVSWVSTTSVSVSTGLLRNSLNYLDINIGNFGGSNPSAQKNTSTLVNAAINGFNGLDTGVLIANSIYYVHVVADSTGFHPVGAILSLSTNPVMPFGYDSYRRVSQVLTNGSSQILQFVSRGNYDERYYQYDAPIVVVNGLGSTTPVALPLAAYVPVGAGRGNVIFNASFIPATAGNSFSIRPTGGTGYPVVVSGPVVSQACKIAPFSIAAQETAGISVDWVTTAAGDALTLSVVGYVDYV